MPVATFGGPNGVFVIVTSGGGLYDDSSMMWILSVVRFRCGDGFLLGMRLIVLNLYPFNAKS